MPRLPGLHIEINHVGRKSHGGNKPPQKQIRLPILRKGIQCLSGKQTIIRMIRNHAASQKVHQPVVGRSRGLLEKAVGVPVIAHAVNHLAALHIACQKKIQRLNILL